MNLLPKIKVRATPREGYYRLTISRHPSGRLTLNYRGQPTLPRIAAHLLTNRRPRVRSFFRPGELSAIALEHLPPVAVSCNR